MAKLAAKSQQAAIIALCDLNNPHRTQIYSRSSICIQRKQSMLYRRVPHYFAQLRHRAAKGGACEIEEGAQ